MRYKKGDICYIKKDGKFVEGVVNKLAMPHHGSSYYKKGDIRYFVFEKKTSCWIANDCKYDTNDILKTYSESDLISCEREWKINQIVWK